MACLWVGISRIVYGAGRDDVNSVYFESRHFDTSDFIRQAFRNDMEIEGGVLSDECSSLYIKKEESEPSDLPELQSARLEIGFNGAEQRHATLGAWIDGCEAVITIPGAQHRFHNA
jgi:hypothetical protein